jgi:hypothetical protein
VERKGRPALEFSVEELRPDEIHHIPNVARIGTAAAFSQEAEFGDPIGSHLATRSHETFVLLFGHRKN